MTKREGWKSDIKSQKVNNIIARLIWGIREGNTIIWPTIQKSNAQAWEKKAIKQRMKKLERDLSDLLKAINFGYR